MPSAWTSRYLWYSKHKGCLPSTYTAELYLKWNKVLKWDSFECVSPEATKELRAKQ